MTLGAMTAQPLLSNKSSQTVVSFDRISFAGDGAYGAGGTAGFQALVRAAVGRKVTVIALINHLTESGAWTLDYDAANDKLVVYWGGGVGAVQAEDATANQSGRTYEVTVLSI